MPSPPRPVTIVGIGGMKCGSTSLWAVLLTQSWFAAADVKETKYFSREHARGPEWYRSRFPMDVGDRLTGEVTPEYLTHVDAPGRIRAHSGDVRLFAILRDPVVRFASHVTMLHGSGRLDATVPTADLIASARSRDARSGGLIRSGEYAQHLERYLEVFPRDQLHVLFLEEVVARPTEHLSRWLRFLAPDREHHVPNALPRWNSAFEPRHRGIDRLLVSTVQRARSRGSTRRVDRVESLRRRLARPAPDSRTLLDPESRAALTAHYRPHNERLSMILQRPLPVAWER